MNTHHGDTEARRNIGLLYEALTAGIIGAAIEVHRHLGPGLLESVYEECMCQELRLRDIPFLRQVNCRSSTKDWKLTENVELI